jgi:aminomethyltransferase
MTKRTPLYDEHLKLNARFTEFGGWDMPVQYSSIMDEHNAVRTAAGIFDTSHMGIFVISGSQSTAFLNKVTTANVPALVTGQAKYSLFLNENGGIIDDLIIYKRQEDYVLVVNAGNLDKDFAWLKKNLIEDVDLEDISPATALLAFQGPNVVKLLQPLVKEDLKKVKYFSFFEPHFTFLTPQFTLLARTGYTGEDGFEIFISNESVKAMWQKLVALGAKPAGLGSRDTLRLEAAMPLHGHEIADDITPLEAGLNWVIYWDKEFIGKQALLAQKEKGVARHLVGFILESGIPRAHNELFIGDKRAGQVTSGTWSPTFKKGLGLGYVDQPLQEGDIISVLVHNQLRPAKIVKTPFYKRKK